jgi:ribokinase
VTDRVRVAVVGAINVDLVVSVERSPAPGETVTNGRFSQHQGGKGGNQAVAAARALGDGGDVTMICSVGGDDLGSSALDALRADGIEIAPRDPTSNERTGVALIIVDAKGENQIAVAPGANAALTAETVRDALNGASATLVLASLEVPREAVIAAAAWSADRDTPFVLNPAPMDAELVAQLADRIDYILPNEHELAQLGGAVGDATTIETRGPDGVVVHTPSDDEHIGAPEVDAVDTTGAGDCFVGVFAVGLAEGRSVREAVERAVAAAAISVTRAGAREGMPARDAIDAARAGSS